MTSLHSEGSQSSQAQAVIQPMGHEAYVDGVLSARDFASVIQRLQTSLEPEFLLHLFEQEARRLIMFDGFSYTYEDLYSISSGVHKNNRADYNLIINQEALGQLSLFKKTAFSESELKLLEVLLSILIYPLFNAINYRKAVQRSFTDPLTGIGNRAALNQALHREVEFSKRHDFPMSVIMLDVDHFKKINDTQGHLAGDAVLKHLAEVIKEVIRDSDFIFRYGGEEFVVLLRKTKVDGAALLAERLRNSFETQPTVYNEQDISATISVGVTDLNEDDTLETFLARGDAALFKAKNSGRNCCRVDSE